MSSFLARQGKVLRPPFIGSSFLFPFIFLLVSPAFLSSIVYLFWWSIYLYIFLFFYLCAFHRIIVCCSLLFSILFSLSFYLVFLVFPVSRFVGEFHIYFPLSHLYFITSSFYFGLSHQPLLLFSYNSSLQPRFPL